MPCVMSTSYCKQKLAMFAPLPGSSDWSTVLERTLMSGTGCKILNSLNVPLACETQQNTNMQQICTSVYDAARDRPIIIFLRLDRYSYIWLIAI